MRTNPQLDPATKELWAGVRGTGSARSSVQDDINELRSRLSGIDAYQRFLDQSSVDSFDSYESELKTRADGTLVSDEQVADARGVVEPNFSSFSDFTGDSATSTGIFGLSDFDGYRDYLTNNGLSGIDADTHNATIQDLFAPGDTFSDKVIDDLATFADVKAYLKNNGFSDEDAQDLVDKFKDRFSDFPDFEKFLKNTDDIEKLLDEYEHNESGVQGVEYDEGRGVLLLKAENEVAVVTRSARREDTVEPPDDADISVSNINANPPDPTVDETVTVTADVDNVGSAEGTIVATIRIDGRIVDTPSTDVNGGDPAEEVTVPASSSRTVSFSVVFESPGKYQVGINEATPISVTAQMPSGIR